MAATTLCYGDGVAEFGRLGAATVDLIVTSLPYNCRIAYGADDDDQRAWPDYYVWMETMLTAGTRMLMVGGTLALIVPWVMRFQHAHRYAHTWSDYDPAYRSRHQGVGVQGKGRIEPLGMRLFDLLTRVGLRVREPIMWVKGKDGQAHASRAACGCDSDPYLRPAHETILLASKGRWYHRGGTGRRGVDVLPQLDWLKDVWHIPTAGRRDHPAAFPIEIPRRLIQMFTHAPDALVADPFMGSGTTGVAAGQLGRAFWGCERQQTYYTVAQERCGDTGGAI